MGSVSILPDVTLKMNLTFSQLLLIFCCILLTGSGAQENETNSTTEVTAPELSGEQTERMESAVQLEHGESRSRAKSHRYSKNGKGYAGQTPVYDKNEYDDRAVEYDKDNVQVEDFYKTSAEDPYLHPPQAYLNPPQQQEFVDSSYEIPYDQQRHRNRETSYEDKGTAYKYPHKQDSNPLIGDYSREDSFESKEADKPTGYLKYAYDPPKKQQHRNYDPLDVPDTDTKPSYGPAKIYPPRGHKEATYYQRPRKQSRFPAKRPHKEDNYRPGGHRKSELFANIPKQAEYGEVGDKEAGLLSELPKGAIILKEIPKSAAGYLPFLPTERSPATHNRGRVAIFIKQLGHSNDKNADKSKERHGYLLLPVVQERTLEKFKDPKALLQYPVHEYKTIYQEASIDNDEQSPDSEIDEKELYDANKRGTSRYVPDLKAALQLAKAHEEAEHKRDKISGIAEHFLPFQHLKEQLVYAAGHYENPKGIPYEAEITSQERPYIPKGFTAYEILPAPKAPGAGSVLYGGAHGVIPGLVKYDSIHSYGKHPFTNPAETPYDITTATLHKSAGQKARGFRPSSYNPFSPVHEYAGLGHLSSVGGRSKKRGSDTSHLYSSQYKNIGTRLTGHEKAKPEAPLKTKSIAIILQKPEELEAVHGYKHASKSIFEELGFPEFESLFEKPTPSGLGVGQLYYDLHTFPESDFAKLELTKGHK